MELNEASQNRRATFERSLRSKRENAVDGCCGTSRGKHRPSRGRSAESSGLSFSAFEKVTRWRWTEKRRSGSSRERQGRDESDRGGCRQPDTEFAFAEVSESLGSNGQGEKGGRVAHTSEHSPMAVVEVTDQSTCREDTDEKCNE